MGTLGAVQDFVILLRPIMGNDWSDGDQHVNGVLGAKEFKMRWGQGSR